MGLSDWVPQGEASRDKPPSWLLWGESQVWSPLARPQPGSLGRVVPHSRHKSRKPSGPASVSSSLMRELGIY